MAVTKVAPRPHGMPKQVVLASFEPLVARFGPPKLPKCLEKGPFCDGKRAKNGSKTRFSKNDPGPFGMHKQTSHMIPFWARFDPVWSIQSPKSLEHEPIWDHKWVCRVLEP